MLQIYTSIRVNLRVLLVEKIYLYKEEKEASESNQLLTIARSCTSCDRFNYSLAKLRTHQEQYTCCTHFTYGIVWGFFLFCFVSLFFFLTCNYQLRIFSKDTQETRRRILLWILQKGNQTLLYQESGRNKDSDKDIPGRVHISDIRKNFSKRSSGHWHRLPREWWSHFSRRWWWKIV